MNAPCTAVNAPCTAVCIYIYGINGLLSTHLPGTRVCRGEREREREETSRGTTFGGEPSNKCGACPSSSPPPPSGARNKHSLPRYGSLPFVDTPPLHNTKNNNNNNTRSKYGGWWRQAAPEYSTVVPGADVFGRFLYIRSYFLQQ